MYQFIDFTLKVVYAVEFSLSTAPSCEAIFAAPSHVVDKLQLLLREDLLFQKLLEFVPAQIHDPVDGERQLDLGTPEQAVLIQGKLTTHRELRQPVTHLPGC